MALSEETWDKIVKEKQEDDKNIDTMSVRAFREHLIKKNIIKKEEASYETIRQALKERGYVFEQRKVNLDKITALSKNELKLLRNEIIIRENENSRFKYDPVRVKQVLTILLYRGFTASSMAEILEIPIDTIKDYLYRYKDDNGQSLYDRHKHKQTKIETAILEKLNFSIQEDTDKLIAQDRQSLTLKQALLDIILYKIEEVRHGELTDKAVSKLKGLSGLFKQLQTLNPIENREELIRIYSKLDDNDGTTINNADKVVIMNNSALQKRLEELYGEDDKD